MKTSIAIIAASFIVSACGGGDSSTPISTPTMKEGLYLGTSLNFFFGPSGQPTSILVLDQQEVWVLDGRTPPKLFGQGKFVFSGEGALLNGYPANIFVQGKTLAAIDSNVLGEISMELRFGELTSTPFVVVPQAAPLEPVSASLALTTSFDYNQAASIPDVTGQWGATAPNNNSYVGIAPLTISNSGSVSTPPQDSGCSVAGTLIPRPSGKNVFNLTVTLTGCGDAGAYTGIAFKYIDTSNYYSLGPFGVQTLRLIATNNNKTRVFNMTTTR